MPDARRNSIPVIVRVAVQVESRVPGQTAEYSANEHRVR